MRLMNYNFCSQDATVITASSQDPNFPASNLKHQFRSKRWRSTGVTSENIVFDLITTESIDSVVLLWSKEDGIKLSNTAVVKIQANATNVWTSPAIDQTLTIDNTYMMASYYFSTSQTYRYWRVVLQDPGNPNGYVELGVVWLGKSLSIQNAENGFKFALVDKSKVTVTDFGHTYVDQYPLQTNLQIVYEFLDYATLQAIDLAFRQNGTRLPVLIALDADGTVFSKDHFTIYGKFQSGLGFTHVVYNLISVDGITVTELS